MDERQTGLRGGRVDVPQAHLGGRRRKRYGPHAIASADTLPDGDSAAGGVYVVEGGRTPIGTVNTGFIVGDKGVVAIDPQMYADTAREELAAIAKITRKPVDTVILTHSDPDHTYGLAGFPAGISIVAQENTKTEMQEIIDSPAPRGTPPPTELKNHLPTRTLRRFAAMTIDGVPMVLTHLGSGHTDGDLVIYLPTQKIAFLGDLITIGDLANPAAGIYPVIHLVKHGTSAGWIKVVKAMLATHADIFVPGHGKAVQNRAAIEGALTATELRRGEIKKMFDQGKPLGEVKAALGEGGLPSRFPTFVDTTYEELLRE